MQKIDKVCMVVPTWFLPKESKFDDKDVISLPNPSTINEKSQEPPRNSARQVKEEEEEKEEDSKEKVVHEEPYFSIWKNEDKNH